MTLKKVTIGSALLSLMIIILMIIFRDTKSELFTMLSIALGATIFFTLLYYLYTTERIKQNTPKTTYKYLFFAISIPFLIFAIDVTEESEGFLKEAIRVLLALEIGYLIFSWVFTEWKNIQTLKNEKAKAELSLLKEQINPHFFFNTLNNLYSLIKKDSDAAQEYVLQLSDLMRFTIYDSAKEKVSLQQEINYLNNFIELQTARYHKDIDINFVKTIQNSDTKIAPLLFIVLLENAFKHGVEQITENASIHLELIENQHNILFTIRNNFDTEQFSKNEGIGLKNLKERLTLVYPNRHQLNCTIEEDIYTATLEIIKQ
ncbi:GHKL domain-containing protein [Dokdonia pacifica]|uniref:GHKL domain-containing protein n=2 Tax=Dokdonia pacifica TaxID=1627892 RepID=A0A239AXX6_9FLAO|nr:GHKL domain-containing protein [Dokdonia pacifica]